MVENWPHVETSIVCWSFKIQPTKSDWLN
jgi:hypothetical protein